MKSFNLLEYGTIAGIMREPGALSGVKRVAETLAGDLYLASGSKAVIRDTPGEFPGSKAIIITTAGHSAWLDSFVNAGLIDISPIAGKRECYMMKIAGKPFPGCPGIEEALIIAGSDKRGTIYGMFRLSEMCGISPLVFWGDAAPVWQNNIKLTFDEIISKEPSVKYRGFFINDEWPAFGKWCTERYGDVNAKAYDKIFELLLRLKGNYLWPAMWNSSFSEDGPGLENARLADEYGVIMGASHHEPMCRAGVEWQQQYKNYGDDNTWSFVTNSGAITKFWKDGILRNRDFENVITIGMRGESDSLLMGEDATIQDNINVLKDALAVQNKLIRENINPDLKQVPRMFAIYKEVEDYFFGEGGCGGLRGYSELDDVILLFSDDNHGNIRAIPQQGEQMHSGGYGMYYHFDYHGGPHSFEWLNHTNPVRAWEQLTMAYEYGIREMWIVNAGDIKGNEYTLSYFMDLAYDYDTWGISNINSAAEYTSRWLDVQFSGTLSSEQKAQVRDILSSYIKWSTIRIPESMHPDVLKNNFFELDNAYEAVKNTLSQTETLRNAMPDHSLTAFESMIYYPVMAFFSALAVNVIAGLNYTHAGRGTLAANQYAHALSGAIPKDRIYVNKFHSFLGGKWNHMMESAHMCFKTWDDNDWCYPVIKTVMPIPYPKIAVSFRGYDRYSLGHHWQNNAPLRDTQLTRPDINEIIIDIDSRGDVDYEFKIKCDKPWLTFSRNSGKSLIKEIPRISVSAYCDRMLLGDGGTASVQIDFLFKDGTEKKALLSIEACNVKDIENSGAYIEAQDYICINAENYQYSYEADGAGWKVVPRLGRTANALKLFPVTRNWTCDENRPYVQYDFIAKNACGYTILFYLSPRNPMIKGGTVKGCYSINDEAPKPLDIITNSAFTTFDTDADWSYGAINNIRIIKADTALNKGLNSLKFYAADPNVILENIVLYPAGNPIPVTHLAPPESCRIP